MDEMALPKLECIVPQAGALVENPLWADGRLLWTDITNGTISAWDSNDHSVSRIYSGVPVGGFTLQSDHSLLLFRVNDIACLKPDGRVAKLLPFEDDGAVRFNDVIAAPDGSVFAGTIGHSDASGGLFHIRRDGSITLLFRGTGCANGMGFSPDESTFYWTDSTNRIIQAWDYDREGALLKNGRIFANVTPESPDGLTIDAFGRLFSARWGGRRVAILGNDATAEGSIDITANHVTSVCFGGCDMRELFITAAADDWQVSGNHGAIYRLPGAGRGKAEFTSKIRIA
jgi:D-xylonolactonase